MAPVNPLAPSRPFHPAKSRARAFSLVEIVLAVGVVSFAFVAILGLLPAGMTQFRQAIDTSVCAQIAQRIIMEAQQTDYDALTNGALASGATPTDGQTFQAGGALRYFDEQGNELVVTSGAPPAAIYQANTRIVLAPTLPGAAASNPSLAQITVQVAFNPGNARNIPLYADSAGDPQRKLFNTTGLAGISVKTYNAQIGRNK